MPDNNTFILPDSIAQPVDVGHVLHELNLIDEHLNQEAIKNPNKEISVKSSTKLSELLETNSIEITDKKQRTLLIGLLNELKRTAPVINVSFGTEAGQHFIQQISQWFRSQIHPYCLLVIGLNPTIGVGTIVRTNNKIFDFSLKNQLKDTRNLLDESIKKLNVEESK